MKRTISILLTALLALAVVPGCGENEVENQEENGANQNGDGDGEGGDGEGGDGNFDDLSDSEVLQMIVTDSFCEAAWQCYDQNLFTAQLAMIAGRYGSVEGCIENLGSELGFGTNAIEEAVASGRMVMDRSFIEACKNDYREAICSGSLEDGPPASCLQLAAGQVPEGDPCLDEVECEGALNCVQSQDDEICYGTCGTYENLGNECGGVICSDDEFCLWELDEQTFESTETCTLRYSEDEDCNSNGQCAEGLLCSSLQRVCVPFSTALAGEPCVFGEIYCEPGTRCYLGELDEIPSLDGTCEPLGEEGDICMIEYDCVLGLNCLAGDELWDTCGVLVPVADGEPCEYADQCISGFCNWNTETCETLVLLPDGEECSGSWECEGGYCEYDEEAMASYCESYEDLICELPE